MLEHPKEAVQLSAVFSGRMVGAHEKRLERPLLARQMAPDFERLVQPAATADSAAFLVAVGAD